MVLDYRMGVINIQQWRQIESECNSSESDADEDGNNNNRGCLIGDLAVPHTGVR